MQPDESEALPETAGEMDGSETKFRAVDEALRLCEFDWDHSIPEAMPVFLIGGVSVCTPGNLVTVAAPSKSAKTAFGAAMMASTMADGPHADTLHVKSANPNGRAVIHFDTEQDPKRHENLIRGTVRRANRSRPPHWFHTYPVKGVSPTDLQALLGRALALNSERHGGVHSVILDGVADFIVDPNRVEECFPFVTRLERLAVQYDTVVICILHLNPVSTFNSSSKSRGHLGSQLERKAETEIRLKRDSDGAISYWTHLARGQPIAQENALRFKWSDKDGYHVCVGSKKEEKEFTRLLELYQEAAAIWGTDKEISYSEAVRRIMSQRKIGEKAAQQRHATLGNAQVIVRTDKRTWRLL